MQNEILSLDDLFSIAKKELVAKRTKAAAPRKPADDVPAPITPAAIYTNPANWKAGRCLALIDEETSTLLGLFTELLHVSIADCRRLVRATPDSKVQGVEYVKGIGWLSPLPALRPTSLTREVEKVLPITLTFDFACLDDCAVLAVVTPYAIVSVRLAQATTFTSGNSEALILPANTDVWPLMIVETKRSLWKMIGEDK